MKINFKNRPTIAHVVSYYPPHIGGMENVVDKISLKLAQNNWPVQVITSNAGAASAPAVVKKRNYLLNRLRSIEFAHTPVMRGLLRKLFSLPKNSVVHLHIAQVITPEAVWLVSKIRRIPYIAHFHLDVSPSGLLGFLFLIYKKLFLGIVLRDASRVIVTSQEQANLIRKKYFVEPGKIVIMPNGVADYFFKSKPRDLPKRSLKLLFVGRLCIQKRIDRLLDALTLTQAPIMLTIVGDGEKRTSLEKRVKNLGLNNVTFVGAKSSRELVEFYQDADVFVLPSDREAGMPLVALEAMAGGLPVIGSDVLGIREFIADCGLLASPSPKAFAQKFDSLWQDKEQLSSLSLQSFLKAKRYSWGFSIKKIEPLYEQVFKENDESHDPPAKSGFNRKWLAGSIFLWGFLFAVFRFANLNPVILNVIGFNFLLLAPGILTYLMFKFPKGLPLFSKLALVIVFSLLELIGMTLLSNTFLPLFGVARPLDPIPLAFSVAALIFSLLLISWHRLAAWQLDFSCISMRHFKAIDWLAALFPLVFVAMSIMGATSLNNGGSNAITLAMLATIAAYFAWLVSKSPKLKRDTITIAIYLTGLSLLLMTSMRGWYTTGHDVQTEFRVFMFAKNQGLWSIGYYRDAYNASLSITLLPTILANLLRFRDPYVYKIFFQLIFAVTPSLVYLIVERYLKPALAIIAAIWFMAFPTYFTDMQMLNRQEIAFLFLALMLWIVFEPKFKILTRQILFVIFGATIGVLHYSTMYSVIAIVAFSIGLRWSLPKLKLIDKFHTKPLITFPILVIFITASFFWGTVITGTNAHASSVLRNTIANIPRLFDKKNTRSDNTSYSLFSLKKIDKKKSLKEYIKTVVEPEREIDSLSYYDKAIINKYPVKLAKDNIIPLSRTGRSLKNSGVDVAAFNFIFRQATAKVLQVLIILGFAYLIFQKKYLTNRLDSEFTTLAAGSLFFVFLVLVLPVISTAYGLLRAFQQSLMLLSLFLVIGSLLLVPRVSEKIKVVFACLLAITFFLSTTGFITQILGGYYPQLHLNNSGSYYDLYYLHRSEIIGTKWIGNYTQKLPNEEKVQFDDFELGKIAPYASFRKLFTLRYIYPALIQKDSYVFAGPQTLKRQSSFTYLGDNVSYTYPLEFLDNEKDLIYNNGEVRVYR